MASHPTLNLNCSLDFCPVVFHFNSKYHYIDTINNIPTYFKSLLSSSTRISPEAKSFLWPFLDEAVMTRFHRSDGSSEHPVHVAHTHSESERRRLLGSDLSTFVYNGKFTSIFLCTFPSFPNSPLLLTNGEKLLNHLQIVSYSESKG